MPAAPQFSPQEPEGDDGRYVRSGEYYAGGTR